MNKLIIRLKIFFFKIYNPIPIKIKWNTNQKRMTVP